MGRSIGGGGGGGGQWGRGGGFGLEVRSGEGWRKEVYDRERKEM